eukprot:3426580-Pleurochrysis_carterae.AAC.3
MHPHRPARGSAHERDERLAPPIDVGREHRESLDERRESRKVRRRHAHMVRVGSDRQRRERVADRHFLVLPRAHKHARALAEQPRVRCRCGEVERQRQVLRVKACRQHAVVLGRDLQHPLKAVASAPNGEDVADLVRSNGIGVHPPRRGRH